MDILGTEAISTFLIDEATYHDLVKRANLTDLLADRIITLEQQNKAILERLGELETFTSKQIAEDRKRLAKLEQGEQQPAQKDRSEILRALLVANGGKMFAKDARNKMHLGKATFSVLLASMRDEIDKKPFHLNRSKLIISLR